MPIEKVYLPPEQRPVLNPDGTVKEVKTVHPWEIRASGKEVQELRGVFKDSAPQMMHEGFNEWKSIGETKITRPDGSVDTVRADKEAMYRSQPGFCVSATRPIFTVHGFGSMKKEGITRARYLYSKGERITLEEKRG